MSGKKTLIRRVASSLALLATTAMVWMEGEARPTTTMAEGMGTKPGGTRWDGVGNGRVAARHDLVRLTPPGQCIVPATRKKPRRGSTPPW